MDIEIVFLLRHLKLNYVALDWFDALIEEKIGFKKSRRESIKKLKS